MNDPVLQAFTITEACKELGIDPKTLHRHCQILNISPAMVSSSGRVKLFSQQQIEHLSNALQRVQSDQRRWKSRQYSGHKEDRLENERIQSLRPLIGRLFVLEQELHALCESVRATDYFPTPPSGINK